MRPVLIAGGGIGGLALAIALAREGVESRVFEARQAATPEGAGIQLGPNATRILDKLGVAEALAPHATEPHCIIVNDGVSGRELTRLPLGMRLAERHGAPYWVVHRRALHETLSSTAAADPLIHIEFGRGIAHARGDGEDAVFSFDDGDTAAGDIAVGADGLWSVVRRHVAPDFTMTYSGLAAARALVPRADVAQRFAETATGVWLSPDAHIVHYPVDGGETLALVAIGRLRSAPDGWSDTVEAAEIIARFQQLPAELCHLLRQPAEWRQWPLFHATYADPAARERTVLIGDAAHPILPFLAQGGAMAIEDADELARVIAGLGAGESPARGLADFAWRRRRRVEKVQAASKQNGEAYHLKGVAAAARNLALRSLPGAAFMRRYDWIYGHGTHATPGR